MSPELTAGELRRGDLIDATRRFVVLEAKTEYSDLLVKDVGNGQAYRLFDSGSLVIEPVSHSG